MALSPLHWATADQESGGYEQEEFMATGTPTGSKQAFIKSQKQSESGGLDAITLHRLKKILIVCVAKALGRPDHVI